MENTAMATNEAGSIKTDSSRADSEVTKLPVDKKKNMFSSIVSYLSMTLESIGSLGGGTDKPGQLWEVELDKSVKVAGVRRIGLFDNLRWPVMSRDHSVMFALQNDSIIKIDRNGNLLETIKCDKKVEKLLGVNDDQSIFALIDRAGESVPACITKFSVENVEFSAVENKAKNSALLSQETRTFKDGRVLYVDRSERDDRGFDVFYRIGEGDPVNISDAGSDDCHHPSISPDFRFVLFIKTPRY